MAESDSKQIVSRYVCIDGIVYAVKPHIKYVVQCKRGFLFGKDRKPEVVTYGKNLEWTPKKEILHAPHEKFTSPWPLRIDIEGRTDWQSRVFETSDRLHNPKLPLIDCTK
ncbi:MAG: hypothetical protein ACTH5M_10055 [Psychrobacter sp.]|jgi:hypothetical protein|uniref:hypothetical protein n=1 Tax=Pseudoalteromonas nigrifaciens TaxID=28109 RepID=UPI003FB6915D